MRRIDTFTPGKSLVAGVALSAVNPKNLALTVAAGAAIADTGVAGGEQALALAVFVVMASLSIGAPVVAYLVFGERARSLLDGLKRWMAAHNVAVMTVLLLVLAAKLIGDAIAGFSR